jgi:SRSO17 transposase
MKTLAPISAWIIDDTGFLKKGDASPGVQRQYTGSAGKVTNCQVGVSLVLAHAKSHVAVDFDLYLPESWCQDRTRCAKAHIPAHVEFRPKWQIALDLIARNLAAGMPPGTVLADSGYGDVPAFRVGIEELGLGYAVGVHSDTKVCRIGKSGAPGRPMTVLEVALRSRKKFRRCTWREGTQKRLSSRFTRHRVAVATHDGAAPRTLWMLAEWPNGEDAPTKFTLSNLPKTISCKELVRTTKERWRIEESYLELKNELGLDHYEGRSYIGWQHHISVVLSCYAFLVAERVRSFPP